MLVGGWEGWGVEDFLVSLADDLVCEFIGVYFGDLW